MLESIKKMKRVILGKDFYFKPTIKLNCKKYGSSYGGWWIATDNLHDKIINIFSFGLGEDITFDMEMIEKFNCTVYGFE